MTDYSVCLMLRLRFSAWLRAAARKAGLVIASSSSKSTRFFRILLNSTIHETHSSLSSIDFSTHKPSFRVPRIFSLYTNNLALSTCCTSHGSILRLHARPASTVSPTATGETFVLLDSTSLLKMPSQIPTSFASAAAGNAASEGLNGRSIGSSGEWCVKHILRQRGIHYSP